MRIWTLISGYDDADALDRACQSVRQCWPDPDQAPIVYSDGAYSNFPHKLPQSGSDTLTVAYRWASLVIQWPVAAPTEYVKRSTYWAGAVGDYALILDSDETVEAPSIKDLQPLLLEPSYLLVIRAPKASGDGGRIHRLFRIESGIHHWGAHEAAFVGVHQRARGHATVLHDIKLTHHRRNNAQRDRDRRTYYEKIDGIRKDEGTFRRLVGA